MTKNIKDKKCRAKNPESCPFHGSTDERLEKIIAEKDASAFLDYKYDRDFGPERTPLVGVDTSRPSIAVRKGYYYLDDHLSSKGKKLLENYNGKVEEALAKNADVAATGEILLARSELMNHLNKAHTKLIKHEMSRPFKVTNTITRSKQWLDAFNDSPLSTTFST